MIILGIDPGFGRMGFGCIQVVNGKTTVLDYGVMTTPSGLAHAERLRQLFEDLEELVRTHKPERVAVEKLFFAKSVTTAMQVAEARGVVLLSAARFGAQVFEYSPPQVKAALTGNGRADKKAMQWIVTQILALKQAPKIDDAADALALALCAANER